ncbi:MAG: hypothetical protein DI539_17805 [Flavobacterium psychrophilum]|nr:MAG: hypothetical protein DI539_17805 [Flavobacterium psychrophilum]
MLSRRQSQEDTQKSPLKRFLFVLGMLFFLLYLALGLTLIFWKTIPLNITYNGRLAFGLLLIVYAFFRFIRLWQNR